MLDLPMSSIPLIAPSEIKFLGLIKRGGQSITYLAKRHEKCRTSTHAVLKLYRRGPQSLTAFQRELMVLSNARHPAFLRLIGRIEYGNRRGLLLELLHGLT